MHRLLLILSLSLAGPLIPAALLATSVTPMTTSQRAAEAGAIFSATTESVRPFRGKGGLIYTRATFAVHEVFKGRVPSRVTVTYRGGVLGNEGDTVSLMPVLEPGDERLLFLALHPTVRLAAVGGPSGVQPLDARNLREIRELFSKPAPGEDLTAFKATDPAPAFLPRLPSARIAGGVNSDAIPDNALLSPPRRFTIADRGDPIRYVIDDEALPPGMTSGQAVKAVENALAAWTEISSLTFERLGYASFGKPADQVKFGDDVLAIQLHNLDGTIPDATTLGLGGQASTSGLFPDGGAGGRIGDTEFNRALRGYVILNHTAPGMQNLNTFEEVLCHEIGHALGLAHSSEDPNETDPLRREAIMYYATTGEGRGATLGAWDIDAIGFAYAADSQPPFAFDRVLRVVSGTRPLANPEVNELEIRGFSARNRPLTFDLYYPTETNGTFSRSGSVLRYTPGGYFETELADLSGGYYDRVFVRFNDGTHLSPPVQVRIVQILADGVPAAAPDGLPDSWMQLHFGSPTPIAGLSRPEDDPDGDGLTNLREFQLGTNPQSFDRFSVSSVTSRSILFPARPYEVYELHVSSDLVTWNPAGKAVRPTTESGEIRLPDSKADRQFFRVERVR